MKPFTYVSVFSGIGGLDLGLDRAGMTCTAQIELDPYCRTILEKHWPEVPRHDDARTAPAWWMGRGGTTVDLVAGGPPCQPVSLAGLHRGMADERWGWPWMLDLIRATQPRYVLVENVPGLLTNSGGTPFGRILADLASLGFDAEWDVLRASDFGAPHPRERLFLLAHAAGVDGGTRNLLGQSRERETPLPTGGLPSLAAHQRGGVSRQWLARQPDVARLAHGLPDWLDRIHALGNAIVPQVAEAIGRMILNHANPKETP